MYTSFKVNTTFYTAPNEQIKQKNERQQKYRKLLQNFPCKLSIWEFYFTDLHFLLVIFYIFLVVYSILGGNMYIYDQK